MILVSLFQFIFVALFIAFMVTQVILPMVKGSPLFPMFRTKRNELQAKVSDLKEDLQDVSLVEEASKLEKKLGSKSK